MQRTWSLGSLALVVVLSPISASTPAFAQILYGVDIDGNLYSIETKRDSSTPFDRRAKLSGNLGGLSGGATALASNPANGTVRILHTTNVYEVDPRGSATITPAPPDCPSTSRGICVIRLPSGFVRAPSGLANSSTGERLYYCKQTDSTAQSPCDMMEYTVSAGSESRIGSVPQANGDVLGIALNPAGDVLYIAAGFALFKMRTDGQIDCPVAPSQVVCPIGPTHLTNQIPPFQGFTFFPCGPQGDTVKLSGLEFQMVCSSVALA